MTPCSAGHCQIELHCLATLVRLAKTSKKQFVCCHLAWCRYIGLLCTDISCVGLFLFTLMTDLASDPGTPVYLHYKHYFSLVAVTCSHTLVGYSLDREQMTVQTDSQSVTLITLATCANQPSSAVLPVLCCLQALQSYSWGFALIQSFSKSARLDGMKGESAHSTHPQDKTFGCRKSFIAIYDASGVPEVGLEPTATRLKA